MTRDDLRLDGVDMIESLAVKKEKRKEEEKKKFPQTNCPRSEPRSQSNKKHGNFH